MMRMRTKTKAMGLGPPLPTQPKAPGGGGGDGGGSAEEGNWEMRPGGMLVQTRGDSDQKRPPPPTIRVRVKYGSVYHEVNIGSEATFGKFSQLVQIQYFIKRLFPKKPWPKLC